MRNGTSSFLLNAGGNISSFGKDEAGELYVVTLGGRVSRIVNVNSPPLVTSVSVAGYDLQPRGAAEAVVTAFGTGLATGTAVGCGASALVSFAGAQGQYEGLDQVNILLLKSLAGAGDVNVVVTVDGETAGALRVRIK